MDYYESLERRITDLEIIFEGKQVGTLYHMCSLPSFIWCIEHNKIEAGKDANTITFVDGRPVHAVKLRDGIYYYLGKKPNSREWLSDEYQDKICDLMRSKGVEKQFISFTRDKKYVVSPKHGNARFIRIVLDGDKISDRHAIKPYDFYNGHYPNWNNTAQSDSARAHLFESEELVESPLQNLTKYIIKVEIDDSVRIAPESVKWSGITPSRLNKFIKLCKKNNISLDDISCKRLIEAYEGVCVSTNTDIDQKIIDGINSL